VLASYGLIQQSTSGVKCMLHLSGGNDRRPTGRRISAYFGDGSIRRACECRSAAVWTATFRPSPSQSAVGFSAGQPYPRHHEAKCVRCTPSVRTLTAQMRISGPKTPVTRRKPRQDSRNRRAAHVPLSARCRRRSVLSLPIHATLAGDCAHQRHLVTGSPLDTGAHPQRRPSTARPTILAQPNPAAYGCG